MWPYTFFLIKFCMEKKERKKFVMYNVLPVYILCCKYQPIQ